MDRYSKEVRGRFLVSSAKILQQKNTLQDFCALIFFAENTMYPGWRHIINWEYRALNNEQILLNVRKVPDKIISHIIFPFNLEHVYRFSEEILYSSWWCVREDYQYEYCDSGYY